MTNYEKAIECAENNGIYSKDAAMQMAEWKDQQFIDYLINKKYEIFFQVPQRSHRIMLLDSMIEELKSKKENQ